MKKTKLFYISILALVAVLFSTAYFSYAFFIKKFEFNGKLNMVAVDRIDYQMHSSSLVNNEITIPTYNFKIIDISVTSINDFPSSYSIYYTSNSNDVSICYFTSSDSANGSTQANGNNNVKLKIKNNSIDPVTVTFGIKGRFNNTEVTLENGQNKITDISNCSNDELQGWDGTTEEIIPVGDTYTVSNAKQLAWISEQVNSGSNNFEGKQVVLGNDINMGAKFDSEGNLLDSNSHAFTVIGQNANYAFKGNLEGNNHIIYNLYINNTGNFVGLFGRYYGTEVKNLVVANSFVKGGTAGIGIIGGNRNDSPLLNIENVKSINNNITGGYAVAGIIGQLANGHIKNCYSSSTVTSILTSYGNAAGIVGLSGKGNRSTIENNINAGTINCSAYGCGGIVGYCNDISCGKINNNINNGDIISNAYYVGGIVGGVYNTEVKNNINNGIIIGEVESIGGIVGIDNGNGISEYIGNINNGDVKSNNGAFRVGGIVGYIEDNILLVNNINLGNIDGLGNGSNNSYEIGGIVGSFANTKTKYLYNNYNKGDVKGGLNAGGIVGNLSSSVTTSYTAIKNVINEGTVEATNGYAGGIIGVYDNNTSTGYVSDFITNAYNKGMVKGTYAAGLVGRNIGIKDSITVGTLQGTNNFGVIANMESGVNISNVYYPNTYTSSIGTPIDITSLQDETLTNILGSGFKITNGQVQLYKANVTIENNEVTSCTYTDEVLE